MKYLSVLLFAFAMWGTWTIIHSEAAVPLETHIGIQEKMANLITDTIKAKKPQATDIQIESIWTEPMTSDQGVKVKAHFTYSFHEPSANDGDSESHIKGDAILEKKPDDSSGLEKWSLSEVKTTNDAVVFEKALVITTGDSAESSPDATAPDDPIESTSPPQETPRH